MWIKWIILAYFIIIINDAFSSYSTGTIRISIYTSIAEMLPQSIEHHMGHTHACRKTNSS